jgi:hypothetical protein
MSSGEASRQTNTENRSQEERRREERRQRQENRQEERRRDQRRREQRQWPAENMQSGTSQAQNAQGRTPEQQSIPAERHEQKQHRGQPGRNSGAPEMSLQPVFHPFDHLKDSSGLNNETPVNEADRRDFEKGERLLPGRKSSEDEEEDFGESRDRPFGGGKAGGKIDSSQRDMGQTGQTMKGGGCGGPMSTQQGPYGPREKHRGPVARGKPLMDDWGKSDKH